ncbi:MAG: type IV pilin N-terminal domain-containing protein [Methanomassiliicoccales archaeon]|nr:type IV pilin N-terminal domain-containing protein [Methanomassiliicoccales archaeon]
MKAVWRKNNNAVSPVIATILMVAITVVLAAVLYVLVMGIIGPDQDQNPPQASLNADENRLILSISKSYDIDDGILQVTIDDGTKMDLVNGTIAGTITFVDNGGDGKIGPGDYFENSALTTSTIKIIWTSGDTSQVIAEGEI